MSLKDILSVAGKPGLYKFISQGRNGIIVESFIDNKRMIVHSNAKVSALEDIAIYTESEEVALKDIFTKLLEKLENKPAINPKSTSDELKSFFEEILPDYDRERVYVSDIKKVISWYNTLLDLNLFKPDEKEEEEKNDDKDSEVTKETADTDESIPTENIKDSEDNNDKNKS